MWFYLWKNSPVLSAKAISIKGFYVNNCLVGLIKDELSVSHGLLTQRSMAHIGSLLEGGVKVLALAEILVEAIRVGQAKCYV